MSDQYHLPAGYPPPGATYNQGPPPPVGLVHPPDQAITQNIAQVEASLHPAYPDQHEVSASYAPAGIPGEGLGSGDLPYGYAPPGAAKAPTTQQIAPGVDAGITDPILIAEMNQAADMMAKNNISTRDEPVGGASASLLPASPPVVASEQPVLPKGNDPDVRPFYLVSEQNEKCVLEVRKENPKPGTSVGLNKKNPSASLGQLWYIGADGFIHSKVGDLLIEADGNHKSVHTATDTGDARQHWILDGNKIINVTFKDECLTLKKAVLKFKSDADVVADRYEGKPFQHWKQVYAD